MSLVKLITFAPLEVSFHKSVVMAAPNELNPIFPSRQFSTFVFVYTKFKPGPISSSFVIAEALIVGLGVELYAVQSTDGDRVEGLRTGQMLIL